MSPRTLWISSAAILGALVAVGLYVRSPQTVSKKIASPTVPTREKPTAFVPVAETRQQVFTVGDRGERLTVAMDEVCLKEAGGKATYAKLDPPATPATMTERLREFAPKAEAFPVAYPENEERSEAGRVVITRQLRVQLPPEEAARVAVANGLNITDRPEYAPDWVIMDAADPMAALAAVDSVRTSPAVTSADVLVARRRYAKAVIMPNDTLVGQQWHLKNATTSPNITHANVENAWKFGETGGVRGAGIRIGIVDDGLQTNHPDLQPNIDTVNDRDWNGDDNDPSPEDSDDHGTAVAGVAGAAGHNGIGVSGVAPSSTLVGLRLIGGFFGITDSDEAGAMNWRNDIIQVKNNSWGPSDVSNSLSAPEPLMASAFANAVTSGRGGKGTIFVWAAGNGKLKENNSNYDGYANSIYTIAVGATDSTGQSSYYSEPGSNVLICAPSNGNGSALGIVTTDRTGSTEYDGGYNYPGVSGELSDRNYTKTFGGTSSATPVVSGVVALMLEKNPNLGWRDVQEILIRSATPFRATDAGWKTNGAGIKFHHQFGAGLVNAAAAVDSAGTWTNLPPQTSLSVSQNTSTTIPNNTSLGATRSFVFTSATHRVEQVTVKLTATHSARADLEITLTSPSGMVSQLATVSTSAQNSYTNWTFSSVQHWGESAAGTWTVKVADRSNTGNTTGGTLGNVTVTLFGAANNPPPVVAITSPADGEGFSIGSAVNVQVSATDLAYGGASGVVSNVELLLDGSVVASDATAPYEFTVNPGPGVHSLVARATDSEGSVNSSPAVSIIMANQPPVIAAASLSSSINHYADQALTFASINASDPENSPLTYSYQWQSSVDGVTYVNAPGKPTATLSPLAANSDKMWRCVVTASDGAKSSAPYTTAAVNLLPRPQMVAATGDTYQYTSGLVLKGVEEIIGRQAIINEFSQGPDGYARDWVEILVLQAGSLAGMQLTESGGAKLTFNNAIWNSVPAGTLIVVHRDGASQKDTIIPAMDLTPADGVMIVPGSTTYFTVEPNWIVLNSEGDSISLKSSAGTALHSLSFGTNGDFPLYVGDVPGGRSAYFAGGKDLNANSGTNWATAPAALGSTSNPGAGATPAAANSPANLSFITKLRTNTLVTPALFRLGTGSSLPSGLTLNSSTGTISGTIAAGNIGNHSVIIERYNTDGQVVSQSYTLTVASGNYAEWIGGFAVANVTAGGDPDFDGLPNLVEYMLGLNPKVRDADSAIVTSIDASGVSITYRQSKTPTDATLIAEWATGLASGETWQTSGLTTQVLEENAQSKLLKVTLPVAPQDAKRFLRLRAVTNP